MLWARGPVVGERGPVLNSRSFRFSAWVLCGILLAARPAAADDPPTEQTGEVAAPVPEVAKEKQDPLNQFWFIGTSNYHLRLRESESKVDRELNGLVGSLLPGWKEPTTFKDWSDDFKIWDLWIGYGRDISRKWSWSIYAGGGAGTIENNHTYSMLFLPVEVDADFTRRSLLAGSSVSFYPWGKPEKEGSGLKHMLRATRPMAEMNAGYTHQTVIGNVTLGLPILDDVLHIKDEQKHHLFWASPRLGVEMPLTERDSLNVLGGYLFFHDHADEFNGFLLEFFVRHRF